MGKNQVTESWNPRNIVTKTSAYTATVSDDLINVTGTTTITMPVISTLAASMLGGKTYKIVNTGTAVVTVAAGTGDTVNGASSFTLNATNDYVIIHSDITTNDWVLDYPNPLVNAGQNVKDDTITGAKLTSNKNYCTVVTTTSGTTAQNVFGSGGAPCALTITGVIAAAKDTNAGNVVVKNGTNTVVSFAKSTTAGVVTGEDGTIDNTSVASAATVTVESSTTNGDAHVWIAFTVA